MNKLSRTQRIVLDLYRAGTGETKPAGMSGHTWTQARRALGTMGLLSYDRNAFQYELTEAGRAA